MGLVLCTSLALGACVSRSVPRAQREAWNVWKSKRLESVAGTNGWTTLVGLHWLREGTNTAGGGTGHDIQLGSKRGSERAGVFVRQGLSVTFQAAPGETVRVDGQAVGRAVLRHDKEGTPSMLDWGGLRMFVIVRGDRVGLRVRDPESPERIRFRGLGYFDYDPRWRVAARFEPHVPPKRLSMVDVAGGTTEELCPGALVFALRGKELKLDVIEDREEGDFFILFSDATRGRSTYGSGRYLHTAFPDALGNVVLDFNFAYSPPCAFTPFATCQFPPRQNWLSIPVEAGEKYHPGKH